MSDASMELLRAMLQHVLEEQASILREVASTSREVAELRREVGDLRHDVGELRREVGELRREGATIRREMSDLRTVVLGVVDQGRRFERRFTELRDDMELMIKSELMGRLGHFEAQIEGRLDAIENRLPPQ